MIPFLTGRYVSIHAPVRGATLFQPFRVQRHPVSIHAPVRGATRIKQGMVGLEFVSIHAPVRGATRVFGCLYGACISFNPRPRAGGDGGVL